MEDARCFPHWVPDSRGYKANRKEIGCTEKPRTFEAVVEVNSMVSSSIYGLAATIDEANPKEVLEHSLRPG